MKPRGALPGSRASSTSGRELPTEPGDSRFTAATSIAGQAGELVLEVDRYSDLQKAVGLMQVLVRTEEWRQQLQAAREGPLF